MPLSTAQKVGFEHQQARDQNSKGQQRQEEHPQELWIWDMKHSPTAFAISVLPTTAAREIDCIFSVWPRVAVEVNTQKKKRIKIVKEYTEEEFGGRHLEKGVWLETDEQYECIWQKGSDKSEQAQRIKDKCRTTRMRDRAGPSWQNRQQREKKKNTIALGYQEIRLCWKYNYFKAKPQTMHRWSFSSPLKDCSCRGYGR